MCQIDVELHAPNQTSQFIDSIKSDHDFSFFYRDFIANTDFVPIYVEEFLTHQKVTLINPTLNYCIESFNFEKYLH